jgi:apolipoprotein N-acyltransferase
VGVLIDPEGDIALRQLKMVPVQFMFDGNPGIEQEITDTPHGKLGVLVCLDSSFTDHPRRLCALGAEILLVPVFNNKKWPQQQRWCQMDMAAFRSIELRRCAVRAASSGVSMIVDATGRSEQRKVDKDPGVLQGEVYALGEQTIFSRGGYMFVIAVTYLFMGTAVILTLIEWLSYLRRAVGFIGRLVGRVFSPAG